MAAMADALLCHQPPLMKASSMPTSVTIRSSGSSWVDAVYSPDDGGWWLHRVDGPGASYASKRIYPTADAARRAYDRGKVKWEH